MAARLSLLSAAALLGAVQASAQQRTTINPVDIDYRYNFEQINDGGRTKTRKVRIFKSNGNAVGS